jgi:translation initiation factor IF-3
MNKTTHHLVQMTPGKVDEFGNYDLEDLPTCRVISKISLREQHQRKLDLARRQAKGLSAGPTMKNLELNWAIAGGDLKHRLGRLTEFLGDGRKVEVMLGPKKKGRKATEQEANGVLKAVRDAVGECKGASEVKTEGEIGGVMTIVFEGRKVEEKKGAKTEKAP